MSFFDKLRRGLDDLGKTVTATVAREQAALVRGQTAGSAVRDAAGGLIVDVGQRIDDQVITLAERAGKLSALVASVATAGAQDLRERLGAARASTPDGVEGASLDSVEDYADARQMVGRVAVVDITDVRGAIFISAGTRLTEDHIRSARTAGLLGPLVYSASQAQPADTASSPPLSAPPDASEPSAETPARKRLPLVSPPDDSPS